MIKKRMHCRTQQVYAGMNLREALGVARRAGSRIRPLRRTGEIRVSHPMMKRSLRLSDPSRRKDATREFTTWLKRLLRKLFTQEGPWMTT
jgi:hypothetical protein